MTSTSSIPVVLLCNERLLDRMLTFPLVGDVAHSLMADDLEEMYKFYARREFQISFQHQDNEIFNSRWNHFREKYPWDARSGPVFAALNSIYDEYIEERFNEVHIKLERYGEWQNIMANLNYGPIAAYAAQRKRDYAKRVASYEAGMETCELDVERLKQIIPLYPLCYPHEIVVEDYIKSEGLNDAHLHINACSFAEFSWLYALNNPFKAYAFFLKDGETPGLKQQFLEIYQQEISAVMLKHLRIARNLRILLRNHVSYAAEYSFRGYRSAALAFLDDHCHPSTPMEELDGYEFTAYFEDTNWLQDDYRIIIMRERLWLSLLLHDLSNPVHHAQKSWLLPLLHVYILLMNEFCNLFTQRESQKGFEQFLNTQLLKCAYTWRHNYYFELFKQFHGGERDSIVHYLDARITAKGSSKENGEQLKLILRDYVRYLLWIKESHTDDYSDYWEEFPRRHRYPKLLMDDITELCKGIPGRYLHLNLTAHFIKKPWKWGIGDLYRYHSYRDELYQACRALKQTFDHHSNLATHLRGVDAACDEQYVPPAVFAPCFRYCRKVLNMETVTFHCGEDFAHLLTGIRVMNDAMVFLNLRNGDRMGHGTALGIDPKRWRKRVPETLYVKREDRMLDLLFAKDILKMNPEVPTDEIRSMRDELLRLGYELFGGCGLPAIDPLTLAVAMKMRELNPGILLELLGTDYSAYDWKLSELRTMSRDAILCQYAPLHDMEEELLHTVESICRVPSSAVAMLMAWFTDKQVRDKGQELVAVKVKKEHAVLFRILQRHLMAEFRERRIVIETLITSNLRIARYKKPEEHHSMRWLLKQPDVFNEEPNILLAFGSDDPGIFVCDAKSEFYMLYASLHKNGVSEQDAITLLREVNDRGRRYSFSNTNTHTHS